VYGIDAQDILPGPRGVVAETYIAMTASGEKYFVKCTDKPLFIRKILKSIEAQYLIHKGGFDRMNFPIKTLKGGFSITFEGALLTVYNFIDAHQSYDYDLRTMGRLEAELHQQNTEIIVNVKKEDFQPEEALSFLGMLERILSGTSTDSIGLNLTKTIREEEKQLRLDYARFLSLLEKCRGQKYNLVVTHGDAGGNILVKTPKNLYLIDWDDIMLAPAERDIWTHWIKPDFMAGYLEVNPSFQIDTDLYHYYIVMMFFTYLNFYFTEITGNGTQAYRQMNLDKMKEELFPGWTFPYMEIARKN
jgi:hypothetical protein